MEHYHSLVIKDSNTDTFLMDYDNDFDEPRLFEFTNSNFEQSLLNLLKNLDLSLSSYSKISDISHVDDNNVETIWLIYTEQVQESNNLKKYSKKEFLNNIQNSSVLPEITKNLIINNINA